MEKMNNYYQSMTEIYNRLQDEESKTLFEARIAYLVNRDQDDYIQTIGNVYSDWHPLPELQKKISMFKSLDGIIVFGCGVGGRATKRILSFWGYEVSYFCDNYKYGEIVDGKKVLSVGEVVKNLGGGRYLVVLASYEHGEAMYNDLIRNGFPSSNILWPKNKLLIGIRGNQYFDVFEPKPKEIFVDAGAYDGKTVLYFYQWTKHKYERIYAFEPIKSMCEEIRRKTVENNISGIEILNNAAWNRREKISFIDDSTSSHMDDKGDIAVQGIDIDSVVNDEGVTFIKMDVEGSELKALEGARNTILRNRPRLAICIYHKPLDVIEIASYILHLVPDYKFYIRHYNLHMYETVLYAPI